MAECYVCKGKGDFKHLEREICKKCFLRNMEKRIKKHLGRRRFKKGDKVLVIGEVEKILLEKAVGGLPLKIAFKTKLPAKIKEFDWILVGKTMDEINREFLEGLFKGKLEKDKQKKFFNLLEPLTEKEIKKYAEIRKIRFEGGRNKTKGFLEGLNKFQEIKYNLYRNVKELREKL